MLRNTSSLSLDKDYIELAAHSDAADILDPLYSLLEKRAKIAKAILSETNEEALGKLRLMFGWINCDIKRVVGIT
jgi:hypothetical protein